MRDLRLMLGSQMATRHDPPDLSGLEDAADVAQRRYEQITTPDMVDALGPDLPKVTSEYRKARDETAAALGAARAAAGRPTVQIADLEATWDDLPVDERRDVLRRLYGLERVIVHGTTPDTWELVVTWDVVEPA